MIKQSSIKIDREFIQQLARRIQEKFCPEKIILFGSYGYGNPGKGSDIDLFIIMRTNIPVREQAFLIRREIREPVPVDVIVRTPSQVDERIKQGDFFIQEIISKGVVL